MIRSRLSIKGSAKANLSHPLMSCFYSLSIQILLILLLTVLGWDLISLVSKEEDEGVTVQQTLILPSSTAWCAINLELQHCAALSTQGLGADYPPKPILVCGRISSSLVWARHMAIQLETTFLCLTCRYVKPHDKVWAKGIREKWCVPLLSHALESNVFSPIAPYRFLGPETWPYSCGAIFNHMDKGNPYRDLEHGDRRYLGSLTELPYASGSPTNSDIYIEVYFYVIWATVAWFLFKQLNQYLKEYKLGSLDEKSLNSHLGPWFLQGILSTASKN